MNRILFLIVTSLLPAFAVLTLNAAETHSVSKDSLNWGTRPVIVAYGHAGKDTVNTALGNLTSISTEYVIIELPFRRGAKRIPMKKVLKIEFVDPKTRTNMLDFLAREYKKSTRDYRSLSRIDRRAQAELQKRALLKAKNEKDFLGAILRIGMIIGLDERRPFLVNRVIKSIIENARDTTKAKTIKRFRDHLDKDVIESSIREILTRKPK